MRELLYKNLTSWQHNKRDIFVEETIMQDGVTATTTRRCLYFIKDKIYIADPSDLKKIADINACDEKSKKHFHVLKQHDGRLGIDKMMCKVGGTFYAVINDYLYCIAFVHTFKIIFTNIPS